VESYSVKFHRTRDLTAGFPKSCCSIEAIEQFKALPSR
jgi:hypothetical protein